MTALTTTTNLNPAEIPNINLQNQVDELIKMVKELSFKNETLTTQLNLVKVPLQPVAQDVEGLRAQVMTLR